MCEKLFFCFILISLQGGVEYRLEVCWGRSRGRGGEEKRLRHRIDTESGVALPRPGGGCGSGRLGYEEFRSAFRLRLDWAVSNASRYLLLVVFRRQLLWIGNSRTGQHWILSR